MSSVAHPAPPEPYIIWLRTTYKHLVPTGLLEFSTSHYYPTTRKHRFLLRDSPLAIL